jgi:hypothetical protein
MEEEKIGGLNKTERPSQQEPLYVDPQDGQPEDDDLPF